MGDERLPEPFAIIPTTGEFGYEGAQWTILRGFHMAPNAAQEAYAAAFRAAHSTPKFAEVQHPRDCCSST